MNLWLDDIRDPANFGAIGYVWVKTVDEAKTFLDGGDVECASLDHDLGACAACLNGVSLEGLLCPQGRRHAERNCTHVGTGYDLCVWMAETGHWPKVKPVVHSANPVGRERMRGVIDRYFPSA